MLVKRTLICVLQLTPKVSSINNFSKLHGSREWLDSLMASHFKAPPSLEKSTSYSAWLKEINIWQTFTDINIKKQVPAIFLTLEGKARKSILELDVKDINCNSGVKIQTAFET